MSQHENDGEINEKSKQQKPNDDADPNEMVVPVGFQDEIQPSAIFKLTAICCDDLFEWLSLKDLHSLGQTCKRMHRLAGIYFQENFKDIIVCDYKQNISYKGIQINGFIQFVKRIRFWGSKQENFQYIGENCNSIRELYTLHGTLTKSMIDYIKNKSNKIETIILWTCDYSKISLYNDFLRFCPNLKSLCFGGNLLTDNEWMCYKYPKLEQLSIINDGQIGNPGIFFQNNAQLQYFKIDSHFLLTNIDTIINSNIKLDIFSIVFSKEDDGISNLLNKLYDNGFYKRLTLTIPSRHRRGISQTEINRFAQLRGFEKLICNFEQKITFPSIGSLKELHMHDNNGLSNIFLEAMIDAFPNLRLINMYVSKDTQFLPLIQRLSKLKELYIPHFDGSNGHELDLSTLNEERKKLNGACKLTIYVKENIYLKTKMAPKNVYANHDLIEIKRNKQCDYMFI